MPQIAIRREGESGWSTVEASRYPDEAYLQNLLYESPSLVPFHEFRDAPPDVVVTLREFWLPGAGSSDLVFVDAEGALTVIECKLARNPEAKREVLAQVLDYGAGFMGMSYAEFSSKASRSLGGRDLAEVMAAKIDSEDFDQEAFRDAVSGALAAGEAELVIAIDQMNPDLRRLLDYIENRSGGRLKVFALEIQYHKADGLEALVPQIANPSGRPDPRAGVVGANITVEQFRDRLDQIADDATREGALKLLTFCERHAEWLVRGKAAIGVMVACQGSNRSLLTLETDGGFWLNAGNTREVAGDGPVDALLDTLQVLPGFEQVVQKRDQKWIKIAPTPSLSDPTAFDRVASAIATFQCNVRDNP